MSNNRTFRYKVERVFGSIKSWFGGYKVAMQEKVRTHAQHVYVYGRVHADVYVYVCCVLYIVYVYGVLKEQNMHEKGRCMHADTLI